MPDAIPSLREDHRRVEKLFKEFEKLHKNDGATTRKREVVAEIIRELSVNAVVEETTFYPAIRECTEDIEDTVLEGLEEHHVAKWVLAELDGMTGDEERFDAKAMVLIEAVRHHVEEEEGEMFPAVREALGRKALVELYERMEEARAQAPTSPKPQAPDEPPANLDLLTGDEKERTGLFGRGRAKTGTKS